MLMVDCPLVTVQLPMSNIHSFLLNSYCSLSNVHCSFCPLSMVHCPCQICPLFNVKCPLSNIQLPMFSVKSLMLNTGCPLSILFNVYCLLSIVHCPMLMFDCPMPIVFAKNVHCKFVQYWLSIAKYPIANVQCQKFNVKY